MTSTRCLVKNGSHVAVFVLYLISCFRTSKKHRGCHCCGAKRQRSVFCERCGFHISEAWMIHRLIPLFSCNLLAGGSKRLVSCEEAGQSMPSDCPVSCCQQLSNGAEAFNPAGSYSLNWDEGSPGVQILWKALQSLHKQKLSWEHRCAHTRAHT
jgi:hypothetical protein